MTKSSRTIALPSFQGDFSRESKRVFWKQVLPQAKINYTTTSGKRATINFDEQYLLNLATAFNEKALDEVPFVLADKDNAHTMDPERVRGVCDQMRLANSGEKPGLYVRVVCPNAKAARSVENNPNLGVSARIREGISTSDGRTFPAGIIHVLGTLDPQVTGMSSWQPAVDLSKYPGRVLDLSSEQFSEGNEMGKRKSKDIAEMTEADVDAMTDEELDAFLDAIKDLVPEENDDEGDDEDDEEDFEDEDEAAKHLVGSGAKLSKREKKDIQLANSAAASANARADEALRRMAKAEWKEYRSSEMDLGVPPYLLDLAEPVLNRPDEMVIDLSNTTGEDDINVAEIVRGFIENARGTVDLSESSGHFRSNPNGDGGDDPDAEMLALAKEQFGF